ncbi:MAG: sigma-54-dependent Fis family transcriptional regulator, partial [Anaerolineae bacterium]|nr:sigma-54-dependent Fis family transcriptional regulator [Anaerolineae bacterium]
YSHQHGRQLRISRSAMTLMQRYPWPGNVRELENVLERAMMMCNGDEIHIGDLPDAFRHRQVLVPSDVTPQPVLALAEAEYQAIIRAGHACQGRVTEMAKCLDISRSTLWRKMKQMKIEPQDFKVAKS